MNLLELINDKKAVAAVKVAARDKEAQEIYGALGLMILPLEGSGFIVTEDPQRRRYEITIDAGGFMSVIVKSRNKFNKKSSWVIVATLRSRSNIRLKDESYPCDIPTLSQDLEKVKFGLARAIAEI